MPGISGPNSRIWQNAYWKVVIVCIRETIINHNNNNNNNNSYTNKKIFVYDSKKYNNNFNNTTLIRMIIMIIVSVSSGKKTKASFGRKLWTDSQWALLIVQMATLVLIVTVHKEPTFSHVLRLILVQHWTCFWFQYVTLSDKMRTMSQRRSRNNLRKHHLGANWMFCFCFSTW